MSIYNLTSEHQLFRASIKKWTEQQLLPAVKDMEHSKKIDASLLQPLEQLGYLSAALPEEQGGLDADVTWHVILLEEIAKAGAVGFTQVIKQHASLALPIVQKHFSHISFHDDKQPFFTYVQVRDGVAQAVVVNGQQADYVIVHNIDQYKLSIYLRDSLDLQPVNDLVGWHTAMLAFMNSTGTPLETIQLSKEQSLYLQATNHLLDAAIFYGIAKRVCFETTEYAKTRIQFDGPLTQFQVVRHAIVDQAIATEKLHQMLYVTAFNETKASYVKQCFALHLFVLNEIHQITDRNVQIHGGNGFMMEYNAQRYWRDSQMYRVLCSETAYGANEIGKLLLNTPISTF